MVFWVLVNVVESYKQLYIKKPCTSPSIRLSSCNILVLVIKNMNIVNMIWQHSHVTSWIDLFVITLVVIKKYEYLKYDLATFSCNKLD